MQNRRGGKEKRRGERRTQTCTQKCVAGPQHILHIESISENSSSVSSETAHTTRV